MKAKFLPLLFIFSLGVCAVEPDYSALPQKALEAVVKNLKEGDAETKAYAIEILGQTRNKRLKPIIAKYLKDQNGYIKISAAKALWLLDDRDSLETLYEIVANAPSQSPINDPLVELKNIAENKIREKAIEAVVELLRKKSLDMLIKLKNSDNYPTIRDVASREMARLGEKEDLNGLYSAFSSADEEVRLQAAEITSKICPSFDARLVAALKKEKTSKVKMFLLDSLKCSHSSKAAADILLEYCDHKNPTLRYRAVMALENYRQKEVLEKLSLMYKDTPDMNLKIASFGILVSQGKITADYNQTEELFLMADSSLKRKILPLTVFMEKSLAYNLLSRGLEDGDNYVKLTSALFTIKIFAKEKI